MTVSVLDRTFSVYSFAAEYLAGETGSSGETISVLLVVIDIGGVMGSVGGPLIEDRNDIWIS